MYCALSRRQHSNQTDMDHLPDHPICGDSWWYLDMVLPTIRQTLVAGFPLILAALVASLNSRLDKLMLAWLSGFYDVGVYHAVTRFSAIWWVVPLVLMKSLAPKFIYPENLGPRLQRNVIWISAGLLAIAMVPCLILPLVGLELIVLILGGDYASGALVLTIHIWVAAFVFLDAPAMQYLLVTNRQHMLIGKSVTALILNLFLNAILIPRMGAVGAAIATLAAQAWAGCIFYMAMPKVRDVYAMQRAAVRQLLWGWWHPKVAVS
jgi:PST family polysaccharide transporter